MHDIDVIFEALSVNPQDTLDYSFQSDSDMNNIEAMRTFLEDYSLEDNVVEDLGTLVVLSHDDYDFKVTVESIGLGDFFSHGITLFIENES